MDLIERADRTTRHRDAAVLDVLTDVVLRLMLPYAGHPDYLGEDWRAAWLPHSMP